MIYVAEVLNEKFIKVGWTNGEDASRRIATLQTGNPFEIKVMFTTKGSLIQEQELHKTLNDAFIRVRLPNPPNEWYPGRNTFMQSFLKLLKNDGYEQSLVFLDTYNQNVKQPSKKKEDLLPNIKWPSISERKVFFMNGLAQGR